MAVGELGDADSWTGGVAVNVENMREWIADLRSGKYEQTYGAMRGATPDSVAYCSLGVGCKTCERVEGCSFNWLIARDWLGLTQEQINQIVDWNDKVRLTFYEIADRVEEWL